MEYRRDENCLIFPANCCQTGCTQKIKWVKDIQLFSRDPTVKHSHYSLRLYLRFGITEPKSTHLKKKPILLRKLSQKKIKDIQLRNDISSARSAGKVGQVHVNQ